MSNSVVVGNGTSRKGRDLRVVQSNATVIACNWFFRDEFIPDILVVLDKDINRDIHRTYPDYTSSNYIVSDGEVFNSGATAVHIAVKELKSSKVFLVGMDFYGQSDGTINNLYAGKKYYRPEGTPAPDFEDSLKHIQWVVSSHPDTEFYHVDPFNATPSCLHELNNFHQISYEDMMTQIQG